MMPQAVFLTDGGGNAGFGHLTRCLSLAHAFENHGFPVTFVINGDESVSTVLGHRSYRLLEWQRESQYPVLRAILKQAEIAVIDTYLANYPVYQSISDAVSLPLYLDDNAQMTYPPGIVLNWSIYAPELPYPEIEGVRYLLGPAYLSLREPFWNVSVRPVSPEVHTVMITFGGDDSKNMTPGVLKFLAQSYPGLSKKVVVTPAFRNRKQIQQVTDTNTQLIEAPGAAGMKDVMEQSDIAVSSGGQTLYELARMGVPAVVAAVADNQRRNVMGWSKTGFIKNAGFYTQKDIIDSIAFQFKALLPIEQRQAAVIAGRSIVPENGSERIITIIKELL